MKVIMILLLFFTIIVGLKSGEVIKVPDGNNIIFGSSAVDGKKSVPVFCIFNEDEIAGCLRVMDVLWIKYLPDEKKM